MFSQTHCKWKLIMFHPSIADETNSFRPNCRAKFNLNVLADGTALKRPTEIQVC